jgi:hypothetical protein
MNTADDRKHETSVPSSVASISCQYSVDDRGLVDSLHKQQHPCRCGNSRQCATGGPNVVHHSMLHSTTTNPMPFLHSQQSRQIHQLLSLLLLSGRICTLAASLYIPINQQHIPLSVHVQPLLGAGTNGCAALLSQPTVSATNDHNSTSVSQQLHVKTRHGS